MSWNFRLSGLIAVFLFSLGIFLFFIFFVNPEYLNFSGFLLFYICLFGWLRSLLLIAGHYAGKKVNIPESFRGTFIRRSGIISFFAVASVFFLQIGWFSIYTILGLAALMLLADYWLRKKQSRFLK